jgi:hypothetical protein
MTARSNIIIAGLGSCVLTFAASAAFAQQCSMGPKCTAISARVEAYVNRVQSGTPTGSIHNAAMSAFCINEVGADASNACAAELTKMGRPDCAEQARAQAREYLNVAMQARKAASQTASTQNWRPQCGW